MKKDYESEALRLSKAIDIAIAAFKNHPPLDFSQANIDHVVGFLSGEKEHALNPEPKFRNLTSLKYNVDSVFTYFQEGTGDTVEYFWNEIEKAKLGYKRVDRLQKILDRGKIRGRIEFDYAKDVVLAAMQTGSLSKQEANRLSGYINDYEFKSKRK